MAKINKFNVLKYINIGFIGSLVAYFVSLIFKIFSIPIFRYQDNVVDFSASIIEVDLRNQILNTAYYKELGVKVLDFLQGTLGFNVQNFIGLVLGTILVVIAGRIIVGYSRNKLINKYKVLFSFLAGTTLISLFMPILLGIPLITSIVSMILYGFLLGIVMQIMVNSRQLKFISE